MYGETARVDWTRHRGDTWAPEFALQSSAGVARDITGNAYKLTVNKHREPSSTTHQVLQLTGQITNAAGGLVRFNVGVLEADTPPGLYFYDVEETTGEGLKRTIAKGTWQVLQDITK